MDIAPTVLALMGLTVPGEMDGQALFGEESRGQGDKETRRQGDEETGGQGDIATTASGPAGIENQGEGEENPYSEEDEEQVMERLRDLGYVA